MRLFGRMAQGVRADKRRAAHRTMVMISSQLMNDDYVDAEREAKWGITMKEGREGGCGGRELRTEGGRGGDRPGGGPCTRDCGRYWFLANPLRAKCPHFSLPSSSHPFSLANGPHAGK